MRNLLLSATLLLMPAIVGCLVSAQQPQRSGSGDRQEHKMDMDATMSMSSKHMDMGPHMKMTEMRALRPGDQQRADQIAQTARQFTDRYKDYRTALKDEFQIFMPNVPQKIYHFTNWRYAFEAEFHFNAEHPTSLLYEKKGDGYELVGAMYTASARSSEDELDKIIPLSVARWHQHVNFCFPPAERRGEMFAAHPRFGMAGSIDTKEECEQAGGKFVPRIFGWMVHVYPYERKPESVWSMER